MSNPDLDLHFIHIPESVALPLMVYIGSASLMPKGIVTPIELYESYRAPCKRFRSLVYAGKDRIVFYVFTVTNPEVLVCDYKELNPRSNKRTRLREKSPFWFLINQHPMSQRHVTGSL